MILTILTIVLAYFLGSVPTAVWIGKVRYNLDVREHGSGNAGATNTFRVLGWKPGLVVFLIDTFKGFMAVYITQISGIANHEYAALFYIASGLLAVLGHIYPILAGFNGGKGVATMLGIILALHAPGALIALGVFALIFFTTQYVSLGSLAAAVTYPLVIFVFFTDTDIYLKVFSILLAAILFLSHRGNIVRLVKGDESKVRIYEKH